MDHGRKECDGSVHPEEHSYRDYEPRSAVRHAEALHADDDGRAREPEGAEEEAFRRIGERRFEPRGFCNPSCDLDGYEAQEEDEIEDEDYYANRLQAFELMRCFGE